jgi:uncharacterized membrane protein HdeD (DUF308 family)
MLTTLAAMTATEKNALIFGIISLAFGVLILLVPRVLNYIVAFYLIVIGIIGILRAFS